MPQAQHPRGGLLRRAAPCRQVHLRPLDGTCACTRTHARTCDGGQDPGVSEEEACCFLHGTTGSEPRTLQLGAVLWGWGRPDIREAATAPNLSGLKSFPTSPSHTLGPLLNHAVPTQGPELHHLQRLQSQHLGGGQGAEQRPHWGLNALVRSGTDHVSSRRTGQTDA